VADKHRVARDARLVPGVASLRGKLRCVHRAAKGRCKIQSEALTDKEEAYEYGEAVGRPRPPIERSKVLERPSSTLTRSLRSTRASPMDEFDAPSVRKDAQPKNTGVQPPQGVPTSHLANIEPAHLDVCVCVRA
jgi:hypothetical protein